MKDGRSFTRDIFPFRAEDLRRKRLREQPSAPPVRLLFWGAKMASTGVRRMRYKRPVCPFCHFEDQVVRIVYGDPEPETIEQSRRQEVALGGACAAPDAPQWYCRGCLRRFDAPGFADSAEAGNM